MKDYNISVGEKVSVEGELREVTEIIKNSNGDPVIVWQSRRNSEGACPPYIWQEWRDKIPQDKRREL